MKIGVIGYGLIGHKRISALQRNDELIAICDVDVKKLKKDYKNKNIKLYSRYTELIKEKEIEIVIISVTNNQVFKIVNACLQYGKNVLCEKPLGINSSQASKIKLLAEKQDLLVKVGFNHRFHPAINDAKKYLESGLIGKLLFIRSYYGHGGRPGLEKEWRSSKKLCGGGELLDQGIHLVDLFRWFSNSEAKLVYGSVWTSFWNIKVEDNAVFNLEMRNNVKCNASVSWTNWKNEFYFCIFGTMGYLKINGLGGSYGDETLEIGKRNLKGGKPYIKVKKFVKKDISWNNEWKSFKSSVIKKQQINGNALDGLKAIETVEAIYKSNKLKKVIKI
jgi:predicted dehydrogenase